jgi:hypothetical protein
MSRFLTSLALAILAAAALLAAPVAHGASPDIVVSQVYAGGGNAGAAYTHDFVELFNRGGTATDVTGWTIQYASANGTTWEATPLSGSIQPGRHYLVQLASAAAVGSALPSPDATGTTNLANTGGKVALVRDSAELTCGASPGSCSASPQLADLVGWGTAADFEGTGAAPALSNTTADLRAGDGCTDTDDNAGDFTDASPAPRSSSTPAASCGSNPPPPPPGGTSGSATVDIDILPALSVALEHPALGFGNAAAGETPAPLSQRVTVTSNSESGYALTVHRSPFSPADLPLGLAASAPSGGQLGGALAGGATAPIPIAPAADLVVGTTPSQSAPAGDAWDTEIGFVSPLPSVAAGRYTATVTFTVIGQ